MKLKLTLFWNKFKPQQTLAAIAKLCRLSAHLVVTDVAAPLLE